MTSSQVLLGIKDKEISRDDLIDWKTNKIGGEADQMLFHSSDTFDIECQLCNRRMVLAVQLYCPLGNSPYHRTLYVFCCVNQPCWNKQQSWKVFRCQVLVEEMKKVEEPVRNQQESWLDNELDWSESNDISEDNKSLRNPQTVDDESSEGESSELSEINSQLASTRLVEIARQMGQSLPWEISDMRVLPDHQISFKSYYINVFEEPSTLELENEDHIQMLMASYHVHEGDQISKMQENAISGGCESYEKGWIKHGDTFFQKFANRIARCQEQVIRYCWNGSPLLISKPEGTLPLCCHHCNGPAVFELQLMPALVGCLKLPQFEGTPVEFGTVIIITCQASCWYNEDYHMENVYVQSDPEEILFQQMT